MAEPRAETIDDVVAEMNTELDGDPLFSASKFWTEIGVHNLAILRARGIENFKRTLGQNYFNFLITSILHPLFRSALRGCGLGAARALCATRPEPRIEVFNPWNDDPVVLNSFQRWVYAAYVGLVWQIARSHDRRDLCGRLSEPALGNPIVVRQGGRLISQDLANSILECNLLRDHLPAPTGDGVPCVAELGAGYGRLAHAFLESGPGRYVIFDIPPALHVAAWYLSRLFPDRKVFRFRRFENFAEIEAELARADIAFFTSNQSRRFPAGYFDAIVSISTLPEMSRDQFTHWMADLQRLSRHAVILKQLKDWRNEVDDYAVAQADYRLGDDWTLAVDRTDPIQPTFFNRVWDKRT